MTSRRRGSVRAALELPSQVALIGMPGIVRRDGQVGDNRASGARPARSGADPDGAWPWRPGRRGIRRARSAAPLAARRARRDHRGQPYRARAARARAAAPADDRGARGDARHDLRARAARGRAQLAAQPGGAAGVRRAGRGRDLSLSAPLLRVRSDQRILCRHARRPQRDDRALGPARRRSASRVAGPRRAPPVHRVHDTVHRPGVRLPARRHGRAA